MTRLIDEAAREPTAEEREALEELLGGRRPVTRYLTAEMRQAAERFLGRPLDHYDLSDEELAQMWAWFNDLEAPWEHRRVAGYLLFEEGELWQGDDPARPMPKRAPPPPPPSARCPQCGARPDETGYTPHAAACSVKDWRPGPRRSGGLGRRFSDAELLAAVREVATTQYAYERRRDPARHPTVRTVRLRFGPAAKAAGMPLFKYLATLP